MSITWYDQLTRIRRYLRDPNAKLWTDAYLLNLYNDVQQELQGKTSILEDVQALRVPQLYHISYLSDWEWRYIPTTISQFYQCFKFHHQSQYSVTYYWEMQELTGVSSDVPDNNYQFTHPWEQLVVQTNEPHQMRFPKPFLKMKFIAYDQEPIAATTLKDVSNCDSSYKTYTGTPVAYYRPDELENAFVLYPTPNVANWLDEPGGGMALFDEDDVLNQEVGTVVARDDTYLSSNVGIAIDIVDTVNNVFMVYQYNPTDLVDVQDESDFPEYLRKYIEYGVIARAFRANNDGKIRSLAEYWEYRYQLGIQLIKKFKNKRQQDRNYKLKGGMIRRHRRKHPRLPSHYPNP